MVAVGFTTASRWSRSMPTSPAAGTCIWGDVIRVDVLGRPIDLTVASLRQIDWRGMGLNFFTLVASPGLLARAPHTDIATVRAEAADQGALLKAVTDALPNVSGIRVADVLRSVGNLLGQLAAILSATGSLTLAAGALVLAGAVAAGQRRRIRQAVILKSLGATRAQIRRAWLTEFGVLGAGAGLIAAVRRVRRKLRRGALHYAHGLDFYCPVLSFSPPCGPALALMLLLRLCWHGSSVCGHKGRRRLLRNE